jgi:zinc transporter, ZIP family
VLVALGWGLLAASSLVVGAALGVIRDWNERLVGLVLGFGARALLVMLMGSMISEAGEKARDQAGLAAVLGFAVAAGLALAS